MASKQALAALSTGMAEMKPDIRVFIGDRELTDIVKTEVKVNEGATVTQIKRKKKKR